jgi:hypothetical protein
VHSITKLFLVVSFAIQAAVPAADGDWRTIPLISNGQVSPDWVHIGYGRFVVDADTLRTDPAPEGLGLLVYKKEALGNCQIRVVFKTKERASNSGFYVRLDEGILKQLNNPGAKYDRDASGKPSAASSALMKESAEREEGIWYGVHHGYEVQIAAGGDPTHGTGSIYSVAPASGAVKDASTGWKTMLVTLNGTRIDVEYEGEHVTTFDSTTTNLPPRKIWWEPKREPRRPEKGYIGLQTHDPKDIVWFKEISVRPLPSK